ncbi:DUF192 domain-containing protein [bacterium]|nr:DUF192 domain-containing protein [bacterium]
MHRARLGSRSGMLFIFPSDGIYAFWMKNTPIPLDIIWIGSNKQIAFIKRNAVPFSEIPIVPSSNARWVLEIRGGSSQANGFSIGDNVKINI